MTRGEPSRLEAAVEALARGEIVVLYDEKDPMAGGCLCAVARRVDAAMVNFMVTHARGLLCLPMTERRMRTLGIPLMATDGRFSRGTAFGASIEAREGVTTGISAGDRARTIAAASAPGAGPQAIVMPGHVHPVQVRTGGVLIRAGLAEAAVDLAAMTGDQDVAVTCVLLDDDGALAGIDNLERLAADHAIEMVSVGDVVDDRLRKELVVQRVAERSIESSFGGAFRAIVYRNDIDGHEHMALVAGDLSGGEPVTVRVHSQCLTGDVLGSLRCDCGEQLEQAMARISAEGRGAIIYMHQEGRGIGLGNKLRAYALQDHGRDTVEANLELGFEEDLRDYGLTAQIIKDLGIRSVRLLTNNPQKVDGLVRYGVDVVERAPLIAPPHEGNIDYLRTKRAKLGHLFDEKTLGPGSDES
jgi:3,4-dihydroxy 2-butanone 4-phosphate synthase/GTP cyclohydrolase II